MKLIDKLTFYRTKNLCIGRLYHIDNITKTFTYGRTPINDIWAVRLHWTPLNIYVAAYLVKEPNTLADFCYRDIITHENYAIGEEIVDICNCDYYRAHYTLSFVPLVPCTGFQQKYISKEKVKNLIKEVEQKNTEYEKQHQN